MNRRAVEVASHHASRTEAEANVVEVMLTDVPMLNSDFVDDPPLAVSEMRSILEGVDGVFIAAPEYAGGVAGGMKNALDWLVGSGSLYHQPVVVLSAGTTGGPFAIEQLVRTLSWQGALTVGTLGISAPRTKVSPSGEWTDPETIRSIEGLTDHLIAAISMDPGALLKRVSEVVTPFGIDPERFGSLD